MPNEFDLSLINALQLAPRATWAELAPVLDADPTTLARRWKRLEDDGLARIAAFPRRRVMARRHLSYVELSCRNGTVERVAAILAEDRDTLSIQFVAGSHQLMLTVVPGGGLADYLLNWVGGIPDVVSYRVHVVTEVPREAYLWQVRALSPGQRRRLRALAPARRDSPGNEHVTELDQGIVDLLCADARLGYQTIAERLEIAPTTAARRINRLLRDGLLGLRCDISRAHMGWPSAATLWGTVEPEVLDSVPDLGDRVPEVRLCTTIAGPENTLFILWLRDAPDLTRVERRLLEELPGLRIADRRMTLRTFKFMGGVTDADQRFVRSVPVQLRSPDDR
ncbi:Lrp/AsnC family transcriptional regulator [Nocardiopsis metallicus]|uniref:DNA-binding Lrp family transcriptional regulator n=2 Tax=Nocardiopsis metallicus TaxID=179819 RepID=A0A840WHQ6_9ACTN|nr:Lrp/AsnC family transcriptional regulator [Nocardiopsis metallicus]MBB5495574.1 DNA-binding Lrp family transcriptional regulator [Nocardiopsis metallicus]